MIQFDLTPDHSSILKVIGVGGGGGNAVNHMHSQQIEGVNFIICNTDAQALASSKIPNRIQLGPQLTGGLGAGANPDIGRQATEESLEEVKRILEQNTRMAFITAGMGGGTGTGGAPIIAKICRDLGVLTVGIVTTPFAYEGKKRQMQAEEGIKQLKEYVDTLLVISNDKLRHQFGNLKMREAFEKADNVLATAAKCITDVINTTGQINVDFADVCTVMRNGGVAILGNATASGEDRAQRAIEQALNSPLLNDNDIRGAKWILININAAEGEHEFTMDEVETIQTHLLSQAGEHSDVILGMGYDNTLGDNIGITLIATGFENKNLYVKPVLKKEEAAEGKIVMTLQLPNAKEEEIAIQSLTQTKPEEKPIQKEQAPPAKNTTIADHHHLAPVLVEDPFEQEIPMPTIEDFIDTSEKSQIVHLTLFDADNSSNNVEANRLEEKTEEEPSVFHSPAVPTERVMASARVDNELEDTQALPLHRNFLTKPNNIYEERNTGKTAEPTAKGEHKEPVRERQMELFEKPDPRTEPKEESSPQKALSLEHPHQEEPVETEQEVQRRKQMERLQKLRNLSFNSNAGDPTSEFETVPAYIRRNMELYNNASHIESYYSKFEVSTDDKNQGQINTINTFLDGKKPD